MTPLNNDRTEPDGLPLRDAWLTAYLDGELGPVESARVEEWLAEEPATRDAVEADRRLSDLLDETAVQPPSAKQWGSVLKRIETGIEESPAARKGRSAKLRSFAKWFTAAAALLIGLGLGAAHLLGPGGEPDGPRPLGDVLEVVAEGDVVIDDMDPFDSRSIVRGSVPKSVPKELLGRRALEVARVEEVAVITMDGNDTDVLVVGDPPVAGPLVMVKRGDVRVNQIVAQGRESNRPYLDDKAGGGMPMIMVPLKIVRRD